MKNDKEFIDGIYEKARMLQEQKTHNNQVNKEVRDKNKTWFCKNFNKNMLRAGLTVTAVVVAVLLPHILINQGNHLGNNRDEYSIEPATYGVDNQRALQAKIMNGEGKLVNFYTDNGDYYYLIKINKLQEVDSGFMYIVLYDNGLNHSRLEKVSIGMEISFTYVDTPLLLENVQSALNGQFEKDRIVVYSMNSIQIKE
jgi:hypothetical protein